MQKLHPRRPTTPHELKPLTQSGAMLWSRGCSLRTLLFVTLGWCTVFNSMSCNFWVNQMNCKSNQMSCNCNSLDRVCWRCWSCCWSCCCFCCCFCCMYLWCRYRGGASRPPIYIWWNMSQHILYRLVSGLRTDQRTSYPRAAINTPRPRGKLLNKHSVNKVSMTKW